MAINNNILKLKDIIGISEYENYNKFGLSNVLTIEKTKHNYFILLSNGILLSIFDIKINTLGRDISKLSDAEKTIGKVEIKEKVIDVQCGNDHVLALTINGNIYAWGEFNSPQVGQNVNQENEYHSNYQYLPRMISYFEVIYLLKKLF